jgi:hypothetical protein
MPKRSWRRKTMQTSIETGEPQDSEFAFKVAFAMTLLIWTVGGLAIAWAIFARCALSICSGAF